MRSDGCDHSPLNLTTQLYSSLSNFLMPRPARVSRVRGGRVARELRQERRLRDRWERLVCASLDRGRQMVELRMVPVGSGGAQLL